MGAMPVGLRPVEVSTVGKGPVGLEAVQVPVPGLGRIKRTAGILL